MACRTLVPQPGMEPVPPAVEVQSTNHWTAREFPVNGLNAKNFFNFKKERDYQTGLENKTQQHPVSKNPTLNIKT